MRFFAVSILSVFVVLPSMASVRLPVVNVGAAGVSARAAFGANGQMYGGASVSDLYGTTDNNVVPTVAVAPVENKKVVQRTAVQNNTQKQNTVDTGASIIASGEILNPRRPNADLWAKSDVPLRMPNASEFKVLRSDAVLSEESLDVAMHTAPMAEIDAQIARLTELQHRADDSFNNAKPTNISSPIFVASDTSVTKNGRTVVGRVPGADNEKSAPVKLSRLVVPSDDDVAVRAVKNTQSDRIASVRNDMTNLNPSELRQAFRKTFLSENKHLSTYSMDSRFDVASDMSANVEGFTARRDLSETGGIRPLEVKIRFRNEDSALSRDNYNLLSEYAGIVMNNPTRAIQVAIPQNATTNSDDRKLAARRLAIVEQVLRDNGVSEERVLPVLSQRDEDVFVLRIISLEQYETLTKQQRNMFGDTVNKKTYKSMAW